MGAPATMTGNKTSKDRARGLRRVNITIDPDSEAVLRALGGGELSLGIREAARRLRALDQRPADTASTQR